MLKVGLIGFGSISKGAHMSAYRRIKEENGPVVVEAICDLNPARLEGLEGYRLYTSVEEMLEKEQGKLDYVDICVPTYLHAKLSIQAMEAGYNVLCEKPMARNVEECQQMIDASKRTGKLLMTAFCNRFYGAAQYVRDLIKSGELGAVRNAEFSRIQDSAPTANPWFLDGELSGGAALDLHIHDVDLINWMFGVPKSVNTVGKSSLTKGGYDSLSTNFLYDDNMFVHAYCDWTTLKCKYNVRTIAVYFEKGYVYVDRSAGRQVFVKVTNDGEVTDMSDNLKFEAYYGEIMYYTDCLANGKPVSECLPENTIHSVRMVLAEIESADKNGQVVTL